jgi:iron(III) transport system substrate-binding protein
MVGRVYLRALSASILMSFFAIANAAEVNVYSYRQPQLIKPMFDAFTDVTGITVNVVYAKAGILEKLQSEGLNSPADLVFTVDIGRLSDLEKAGLTQSVNRSLFASDIPENFMDPGGHWLGLTARARIIVASKERIAPSVVATYEDLADSKWEGRICTRSGKHPYMVALTASMIAHHGLTGARSWLSGLRNNLARKPQGNDRAQVKAITEGVCDIAVINHYYMAKMLKDPEQMSWAESVNVIFPNQADRGTHMNVSGVALTKHAPNKDNAIKLMAYLASDAGQEMYTQINAEYPVKLGISWSDLQNTWGIFKADSLSLAIVADNRAEAIKLADEVKFDD